MPIPIHLFYVIYIYIKTIRTLSAASTNSDRKSANSLIKSVWCPGGLYTVASTNLKRDLSFTIYIHIYIKHQHFKRIIFKTRLLTNSEDININYSNTSPFAFQTRFMFITVILRGGLI